MNSYCLQSLTKDVVWHVFLCIGDTGLRATACALRKLLSECTCARLYLYLQQLNLQYQNLTAFPQRLCPGGGGFRTAKTVTSVQRVLEQLSSVAERGDQAAIAIMLPWIERGDPATRAVAIRSVASIARKGDRRVIGAIVDGICRGNAAETSGEALKVLVDRGDAEVVDRMCALLEVVAVKVRYAAMHALATVAERGDERVVSRILAQAGDENDGIRRAAMHALGQLVLEGDHKSLTCMIRGLKDESVYVRGAATAALQVASGGSFTAVDVYDTLPDVAKVVCTKSQVSFGRGAKNDHKSLPQEQQF
eukprot:CAMPEP_0117522336 /NCGR_PEP_ID=MMETSP0784-20121206/34155_1 /TAXON_ID=39447 /ORGANISM="" /LENGTH=306 /DNA_ID=CAMNT_0005318405 /DNA_START=14 /DNA_END=934 /DNA_ORIENTATION=-